MSINITNKLEDCILSYESFNELKNSNGEITPMKAILGKDCPQELNLNADALYVFRKTDDGGLVPLTIGLIYSVGGKLTEDRQDVEKTFSGLGF